MFEITGKFNTAKVFTDTLEETAIAQITELCNQEGLSNEPIRIMPDAHAGAGCVVGTVMRIADRIVPNLVGVDIGCGMGVSVFNENCFSLNKLDECIRRDIPHGFDVRKYMNYTYRDAETDKLKCWDAIENKERIALSMGTLGGGNHFIEVGGFNGNTALVVHTGSRNLGKQVCEYYQKMAVDLHPEVPKDLAYLDGQPMQDYLHDMKIVQKFADLNRKAISFEILADMNWKLYKYIDTVHNYIDTDTMILRKGAISAGHGEVVIIPMNMRDGSLLAVGRGHEGWLSSAPHGAGRVMSRSQAKKYLSLEEYEDSMKNVWTTCVNRDTLDESPMAYKPMDEILDNINDTVDVQYNMQTIYNFKSS